ncbi:MAG: NAD(P)H-dependent glycerol-3-phosphate dehydrogenase [Bacteroidales bacterium]
MKRVAVIRAGSWGTALALHLARVGHDVPLWVREPDVLDVMKATGENRTFLPGFVLPPGVRPCATLDEALAGAHMVLSAVPSHGTRAVLRAASPLIEPGAIVVSATKGLELDTLQRISQVITSETGDAHPVVVLSGPSFAVEVARELPTAVCAASTDATAAEQVQQEFRGRSFRIYATDDVVGVEIGAALKNVIAIAAGVVEGLGLGHNSMAALVTRGLVEISRLACALGGRRETLAGLSGLGDLVLTCTGSLSRNRELGVQLGRGRSLAEILAGMQMVAEGVRTTQAALALGERYGVELPIAQQMNEVFAGRRDAMSAAEALMLRPQRVEPEGR